MINRHFRHRIRKANYFGGDNSGKKWDQNNPDQIEAELRLIYWIIDGVLPYETVGNQRFKIFVNSLSNRFQIPSPKLLRSKLIPDLYFKVQWHVFEALREHAEDKGTFSLTTDMWSSPSKDSFMSLTVHWIDGTFKQRMVVLRCIRYNTTHSAEKIAEGLKCRLKSGLINSVLNTYQLREPPAEIGSKIVFHFEMDFLKNYSMDFVV